MTTSEQLAILFDKFSLGGNYAGFCLDQALEGVSWEDSIVQIKSLNSISTLVFHIDYYIAAVKQVLEGGPLEAKDSLSFIHPPVTSKQDWDKLKNTLFNNIEIVTRLLKSMDSSQFEKPFGTGAYGSTLRNVIGLLEHSHYHLGQIVLLKKLL